MKENERYLRIETTLYKRTIRPSGEEKLTPWNMDTLKADYGNDRAKDIIGEMPKYDGWVNEPSHTDYQEAIGSWLNVYRPLRYQPQKGVGFPNIEQFLRHIFGEKYEIGLDYFQLLYMQPKQKLPILLLVSQQRNTGKTTFLKFLKEIFGDNATINGNEDFKSQFNSDWANKLLIMADETFLNRREEAERLKNLSTATIYKMEAKGKDRVEIDFYGHFVLASNNILCPVLIEPGETRYWVISMPTLRHDDTLLMHKLCYEIPAFLDFLLHRELSTKCESRMWFAPQLYHTPALDRIIANCRESLEADMADAITDVFEATGAQTLEFCPKDIVRLLEAAGCRREIKERDVRRVLRDQWELAPADNTYTYTAYVRDFGHGDSYTTLQQVGRYYSISRDLSRF